MVKIVLFGSVQSSKVALDILVETGLTPVKVFGLDDSKADNVSGYWSLVDEAKKHSIEAIGFSKINSPEIIEELKNISPDYIFVIGLSQLISKDVLLCAKKGVIGVHPAPLPKYRGRAAMVWQMLLGEKKSAVSLFFIDEGMDTGDIIIQVPFTIGENDYADDLDKKGLQAFREGMEQVCEMIKVGSVNRTKQDHSKASYLLKRSPEDGQINWNEPAKKIQLLIRATSHPYPGAFSYYDGKIKIIIWRADYYENKEFYYGLNGQICEIKDNQIDVICSDGILRITDYEVIDENNECSFKKFIVGHKFKWREV